MSLEKCPECGNEVSSDANACPKCGKSLFETNPVRDVIERAIAAILGGVVFAGGGFALGNWYPLTGGLLARIAEPFSPLRIEIGIGACLTKHKRYVANGAIEYQARSDPDHHSDHPHVGISDRPLSGPGRQRLALLSGVSIR